MGEARGPEEDPAVLGVRKQSQWLKTEGRAVTGAGAVQGHSIGWTLRGEEERGRAPWGQLRFYKVKGPGDHVLEDAQRGAGARHEAVRLGSGG